MANKTLFKTKSTISPKWILSNFPKNYENMLYLEPQARSLGPFFLKNPSILEIINDEDKGIVKLLKTLRNEPKELITKLKKIKCTEKVFKTALTQTEFKDNLDHAINEFVLRKMSRLGNKKIFNGSDRWVEAVKDLCELAPRMQNLIILNKKPILSIKAFDDADTLCVFHLPDIEDKNTEFSIDEIIEISEYLNTFLGKVIASGYVSPMYKRLFKSWRTNKQNCKTNDKIECNWMNF
jgi:site-specific DNA-adenine methylase